MIYKKYYLYKKQVSYDGGVTYQDVEPLVTAPSGDPIASYSTLEECEGITSCTCADFTYAQTGFSVSSAATSVTFSYTGCTKPDLTSAATYNWIAIGNHTYDTGSTTGSVIANVSANTSTSRTATLNLSLSGTTCQSLTISQESGETPTEVLINFIVDNDTSSSKYLGSFEIHTNGGSALFAIDETIAANTSKTYSVNIGTSVEGNTVTQVDGVVDNVDWCYTFICPAHGCDLTAGDSLSIKLSTQTSCS